MSDKQLKILGAVLVALVALVALARWNATRPASTASAPVDLKSLKDSSIDKIVLSSAEGSVTLAKSSAGWSVRSTSSGAPTPSQREAVPHAPQATESPADTSTVANFWKSIEGAAFGDLVSSNPANQSTFGLSGPTVRTFTFYEGNKKKAELVIGGPTDSPGTFYVKVGPKDVWTITAQLDTIPTSADGWKSKAPPTNPKK